MQDAAILDAIRQFFMRHGIAPGRIVVAASGGIDSTALLLLLADLRAEGFDISCAHVNHHLRGAESEGDEAFVRELCARLDVAIDVADGALDPERVRARGIEAAAREVRYARLAEIRDARGARFVATAHQKDDQAGTVLMRLFTGSGVAGLRGIHPVRDDGMIRPLLDVTRIELERVLEERGVVARFDRSNADPRFLRNRLRLLIRELEATNNLAAVADQARAQWPILKLAIDEAERDFADAREDETRFRALPENEWLRGALLQRHIRRLDPGARDFDATRIDVRAKRVSVTKNLELIREGEALRLRRRQAEACRSTGTVEITFTDEAHIPELNLTIHVARADRQPSTANRQPPTINRQPSTSDRQPPTVNRQPPTANRQPSTANRQPSTVNRQPSTVNRQPPTANRQPIQLFQLPENARPAFTVRTRRAGDRFQPLGLTQPKKLKDFLIDRKIARDRRDRLPLLLWNGEIVWIAGVEVSERFKVTSPALGTLYEVWLEGSGADDADHSPV